MQTQLSDELILVGDRAGKMELAQQSKVKRGKISAKKDFLQQLKSKISIKCKKAADESNLARQTKKDFANRVRLRER